MGDRVLVNHARIPMQVLLLVLTAFLFLSPLAWILEGLRAMGLDWLLRLVFSDKEESGGLVPVDKIAHLLWFGGLTWVAVWSVPKGLRVLPSRASLVLTYSWLLEFLQGVSGVREASWGDAGANAIGVVLAVVCVVLLAGSPWRFVLGPHFGSGAHQA